MRVPSASQCLAGAQGAAWVGFGLWPILGLRSFEKVTGPKPEGWLAQSVGALMTAIGGTLLFSARRRVVSPEARWLALASAATLGALDVLFVTRRRIKPTYLLDAAVQAAFIGAWWAVAATERRQAQRARMLSRRWAGLGQWNIAPGESWLPDGRRDLVTEASMESFPASDPPAIGQA